MNTTKSLLHHLVHQCRIGKQTNKQCRIHPPPPIQIPCLPCLHPQSLPIQVRTGMASRGVWPCTPTPIKTWKKVTFPWRKVKNSGSWMKTVMGGHVYDDVVPIRIMEMKDLFRPLGFAWFEASMPVIMGLNNKIFCLLLISVYFFTIPESNIFLMIVLIMKLHY